MTGHHKDCRASFISPLDNKTERRCDCECHTDT